jgi:release factor glutamine methyltransferase
LSAVTRRRLPRRGLENTQRVRIVTPPGVFRPISDSRMLADALRAELRGWVGGRSRSLDVCTGSGALAVVAALAGADASAIDVSFRAVLCARINARLNGVRVRALRGDLLAPVAGETFDVITANPPYVPGDDALPRRGPARAWEGGRDGRTVLDRLLAAAPPRLAPGGALLVVHSTLIGEQETLERLRAGGLEADVAARHPGPLGPLMRARAPHGAREEEEVLIFRGRQPARTGSVTGAPRRAA